MSTADLAAALKGMAKGEYDDSSLPAELADITMDMITGNDVQAKPEGTSISLSYKNGSLVVPDSLRLKVGDKVFIMPVKGGQIYGVLFRLSKDPSKAKPDTTV